MISDFDRRIRRAASPSARATSPGRKTFAWTFIAWPSQSYTVVRIEGCLAGHGLEPALEIGGLLGVVALPVHVKIHVGHRALDGLLVNPFQFGLDPMTAFVDQPRDRRADTATSLTPELLKQFAKATREMLRDENGGYRRDLLKAVAQRVDVTPEGGLRVSGCKVELLRAISANNGVESAALDVRTREPVWRALQDSNLRPFA